jgi:hypothetical protein
LAVDILQIRKKTLCFRIFASGWNRFCNEGGPGFESSAQPQNMRAEYWKRKTKIKSLKFLQACRTLTAQFDFMRNCAGAENMCKNTSKKRPNRA